MTARPGWKLRCGLSSQYWQLKGSKRRIFVSFRDGYHGDTAGAASLGAGGDVRRRARMGLRKCPLRRVGSLEELEELKDPEKIAAVVIEPVIQGAAGMKIWPEGR